MHSSYKFLTDKNPIIRGLYTNDFDEGQAFPPPGTSLRITDDNEIRITDGGDNRITD